MLLVVWCTGFPLFAAAPQKSLRGHVPEITRRLQAKGKVPAETVLNLAIGLPVQDKAGLNNFLEGVYDPASPLYHHYLSVEDFAQRFGPSQAQYEQVAAFAQKNHLRVTARHPNRLVLDVAGSVADIQQAFNITLKIYKHPSEDRDFYAPDSEPAVDAQLPVADVSGLNNYILPHPKSVQISPAESGSLAVPHSGSGPSGSYFGNDFRAAYMPGVTLTGAGQSVGLVQFDGFYPSDITAFETAANLPHVTLQTVLLDGYDGVPTTGSQSGNPEVSLDIEMALSMAPGLDRIVVFEAGPNGLENDILSSIVSHGDVKSISCSWGWGGGPKTTTDNLFKQMAAQGQAFFAASGDSDAFPSGAVDDPNNANAPSSCPFITVVGGTTLNTSGPGGVWQSESVWNRGNGVGSSGGISSYYSLPDWQVGLNLTEAGGSDNFRNTPDVAMAAENIHVFFNNGATGAFGGTSCAAPLWAGVVALMNQQAKQAGQPPVGWINPIIYSLAKSSKYPLLFHDIVTGDNTWASSSNNFHAVAGYDLCTGWGTPVGQALIDALAGPPDALGVSPAVGFVASGILGGPFTPNSGQFQLTNSGTNSLSWSLVNTSAWLKVDSANGTLSPGSNTIVAAVLTSEASQLPEGIYQANLTFSNQNSQVAQVESCKIQVGQSIVQNGGFESGDFTGWNLVGNTVIKNSSTGSTVYNAVESNSGGYEVAHSGNYGAFLGDTQLASLSQNLPTIPGQAYQLSFWLDNSKSGAGQQFQANWNANTVSSNSLYVLNNPPALGWTNLQFIVTATGTNSVLQFKAENQPGGFGLDDVSVKPLPVLGFQAVQYSAGAYQLNWLGAAGVKYQVQYSTNVVQPAWINLGSAITGTGSAMNLTDPDAGQAPQRFYRLIALP